MAEATIPILEMKTSARVYSQNGRSIEALRGANLRVKKGEFVCLIGASGCGKSTLLRIVAGFEAATSGDNLMWGKPITGPGPSRGMVFQDYGLFPWLTVRDNIGFGPKSRGRPTAEIKETADRFIELVGLQSFADVYPHQLSGGMKQRVAIARVLANDAEIVLMDEPFGALDAMTRERLQDELLEIWSRTGLTVLFVTHSIEEAIFLADRVVVMSPGPGRIDDEYVIDLNRPRDIASAGVQRMAAAVGLKAAQPSRAQGGMSEMRLDRVRSGDGGELALPHFAGEGWGGGGSAKRTGRGDRPSPTRRARARNCAPSASTSPASRRGEVRAPPHPAVTRPCRARCRDASAAAAPRASAAAASGCQACGLCL